MRPRIAWTLAGLTLVFCIADVLVTAAYRPLWSEEAVAEHGFPFTTSAVFGSAILGALIITRYERHAIGWLLTLIGFTGAFSLLTEAYSIWVLSGGGPGSRGLGGLSGWVSSMLGGQVAIGGLALMFLLAPDGRFLSRRWRWAAYSIAAGVLCCALALSTGNPLAFDLEGAGVGPARSMLFTVGFVLISIGLVSSVISMLRRLRHSADVQRQQLRLIAFSAALLVAGVAILTVAQAFNGGQQTWASALPLFVAYLLLPICFGVAVLRYRLYNIEVILNRAVVLAVATAFAAVGYTTLVVVVGNQVDSRTGGFGVSLLGTAVVALAFQPLRRWVVRLANRLAYGARARPYEALSTFNRRLAETPAADTLLPAVADAAGRAISARGVTVTLDVPGAPALSADWGGTSAEGTATYIVPVSSGGGVLGEIAVRIPRGRPFRMSDERLLTALADQAAVAFRNTALQTQLAGQVAELDRTTHQLAESRSRIIEADDAARRALEAAIAREVLPHLVRLPPGLRDARAAVAAGADEDGLDELLTGTNTALESLRELTRGVFPTQLARTGLEPALRSLLSRDGLAASLHVDRTAVGQRFTGRVEAAVYFCCAEATRALPQTGSINLSVEDGQLMLQIAPVAPSDVDARAILDRVEAVDGSLVIEGSGLTLRVPVGGGPGL